MGPLGSETPFKVAVFGINFAPSTKFHIRIGNVICRDIEYHCSTAVVVTVDTKGAIQGPGEGIDLVEIAQCCSESVCNQRWRQTVWHDDLLPIL